MPDITSIAAAINSVKLALGIAKELKQASDAFNEAENKFRISELYSSLSEARISLADAQEEIHKLQKQVQELQHKIDSSDDVVFKDGVYYRKEPIDGKPNGPFCPACYDGSQRRLSTMSPMPRQFSFAGKWQCNSCKARV